MSLFLYMKIKSSLDWNLVSDDLQKQLSSVDYNPDLHKIYHNMHDHRRHVFKGKIL